MIDSLNRENAALRHGHCAGDKRTRLYRCWGSMRSRCKYPSTASWKDYGGRGIRVCPEWDAANGFDAFLEWAISAGWRPDLELDRIDSNGNYEPSNCRWSPRKQNNRNRRNNHRVSAFGEVKCIVEWIEDPRWGGSPSATICRRLKDGWPPEMAISKPSRGV